MAEGVNSLQQGICGTCDKRYFPVPELDPCAHDALEMAPIFELGVVYSWTRVWASEESSRLVVMVDFYGGSLRVSGPAVGVDAVAIGDRVLLVESPEEMNLESPYAFRRA